MRLRKMVAMFVLFSLGISFLPTFGAVFASAPRKIDPGFYSEVYKSSQEEIIIIKFKEESAVGYSKSDSYIADSYIKHLYDNQMDWVSNMQEQIPFSLIHSYQQVYNGIAIKVRGYNIPFILADRKVDRVFDTRSLNYLTRQFSIRSISAKPVWNLENSKKEKITGKGIKVGVLDTGIDYFHPDFLDKNGKTPRIKGGKDFADGDDDFYDSGSTNQPGFVPHGTHVAGITSGNNLDNPLKKGMAPDSDLFVYKVFSDKVMGANSANVIAAINQSVTDKCSVINLSLGNTSPVPSIDPGNPYYDSILNATKAGVVVVCAAGNEGSRNSKNPYSIHAPGTYEPAIQVAGSDDRMNVALIAKFADGTRQWMNCKKFTYAPPFQSDLNNIDIVDSGFGSVDDFTKVNVKGKIALISRGPRGAGISFQEKNLNAKKAGAIAAITYNYDEDPLSGTLVVPDPAVDPFSFDFIPNIQMSGANAYVFKKAFENGGKIVIPTNSNVSMYDMSSIGPCYSGDENVLKPEVSAPGKQVNSAVMSGKDANEKVIAKYEDWDGTSMATPHATGAIALIQQAHPDWNAFDIKAIVMNTADLIQNQVSQLPFSFFVQGSGQINPLSAILSPMITTPPYLMRNIEKGEESYTFEVRNTSELSIPIETSFETFDENLESSPIVATFQEYKFSLAKGEKKKFSVSFTIDEPKFINKKYEGVLWIQSGKVKNHIPIIIYKGKLSEVEKPITHFTISQSSVAMKSFPIINVKFSLNNGSRFIVKGIEPEMDSTSNHADTFRIYVTDSKKNTWGTIFFAENMFLGKYSFDWNGKDIYGSEIIPNGTFFLMAEISGVKVTLENGQVTERLPMPENSELIPLAVTESSIPTPPLLLVSSPDKLEIDKEFVLELLFADAQDIEELQLKLTWSKSTTSSISYSLGDFVNVEGLDPKKDIQLTDGVFVITAKRDPATANKSRLKIASIRLNADKASSGKNSLLTTVELLVIKDKSGKIRKTLLSYPPLIQIVKKSFETGDFNGDDFINQTDLDLLLAMNQKTYTDSDWDPKYDLNNDLMIDITDFAIFGKYYGED